MDNDAIRAAVATAETLGQFMGLVEMLDWPGVYVPGVIEQLQKVRRERLEAVKHA